MHTKDSKYILYALVLMQFTASTICIGHAFPLESVIQINGIIKSKPISKFQNKINTINGHPLNWDDAKNSAQ